jgi:hypothetical protein
MASTEREEFVMNVGTSVASIHRAFGHPRGRNAVSPTDGTETPREIRSAPDCSSRHQHDAGCADAVLTGLATRATEIRSR